MCMRSRKNNNLDVCGVFVVAVVGGFFCLLLKSIVFYLSGYTVMSVVCF